MIATWLALLLFATAAETTTPPPGGRLCIGDTKSVLTDASCSAATATTIAVKPADQERRFFWIDDDAKTAYAGIIAAKAESVILDPESFSALDTTFDGDATRGWPLDVTIALASPDQQWNWRLDRDAVKRLRRLYVPRGTYRLTATAEHHRTLRLRVAAGAEPAKLELRLMPLPVALGVIVNAEDKAIAGATIALPDATLCATANEQGAFHCELPERVPEALVVSSGGYAAREVPIVRETLRNAVDLGRIRLSTGRLLSLTVVRPDPAPARVTLFLDAPRYEHSKLKSIPIAEREETVRFDAGEGKYLVVVEGEGPLERLEVPVTVKDADAEQEIRVEPFELAGTVTFGGAPLKEGHVEVLAPQHTWRIPLPVTGGAFGATMWQKGVVRAFIKAPELPQSELHTSPELGASPSKWDIAIEKRMIAGRVLDAATKAPVPDVEMQVVAETERSQAYFSTPVGADGTYQVLANRPGTYTLRVTSPQHILHSTDIRITNDDRSRTHDIALESGVLQPIDVVTPAGVPIPNVTVLEGVQSDGVNPEFITRADERGHYELRGQPGASRLLYFVSMQGSLAVTRVQLPRTNVDTKPLQVVVPAPSGALRVRTVDAQGEPFPARLLIRYNGEFVPGAIFRFVTGEMHTGPTGERVFPRLPAGTYEIWVLQGPGDERQLIGSAGALREPVRVGLSSGEQAVTVVAR